MRETTPLDAERLFLSDLELRGGELARLEAEQVEALGCGPFGVAMVGEGLRGRLEASVPAAHLVDRALEAADRIEQLRVALDAPERMMFLLPVGAEQVRREVVEQRERPEGLVHVRARPPAGPDDTANDDLVGGADAGRGERRARRRRDAR